jgi:RNA polymerase sigma factor (sigma-70 family)
MKNQQPLTDEQRKLAEQYVPWAYKLAGKFVNRRNRSHRHDIRSAAQTGLVNASRTYDPTTNIKFTTFSHGRIIGEIKDYHRTLLVRGFKKKDQRKSAPQFESLKTESRNNFICSEERGTVLCCTQPKPVGSDIESAEYVESLIGMLPKKHAAIIRDIYVNGHSRAEACRKHNVSKSYISALHEQSMVMLRHYLKGINPAAS